MHHYYYGDPKEIEQQWDEDKRAWELLDIITAEFKSDPMATQCFDRRIVKEAVDLVEKRKKSKNYKMYGGF